MSSETPRSAVRGLGHIAPAVVGGILVVIGVPENLLRWALFIGSGLTILIIEGLRHWIRLRIRNDNANGPLWEWLASTYEKCVSWALEHGWIREDEVDGVSAVTPYAIGLCILLPTVGLLPTIWAFMILGCGDPTARSMGKGMPLYRFESGPHKGKSLGGVLGFVMASGFALYCLNALFIMSRPELFDPHHIPIQLLGVFVGAVAELFAGRWDNIAIPLTSGFFFFLLL